MRIIDNKKDYYDYLAGILGIDEYITYDRRNSFRLNNAGKSTLLADRYPWGAFYFCPWKNGVAPGDTSFQAKIGGERWDIPWEKDDKRSWWHEYWMNAKNDKHYNVSYAPLYLLVGNVLYIFNLRRILAKETDETVTFEPVLDYVIKDFDRSKMTTKAPIVISTEIRGTAYTNHYVRRSELEKMTPEEKYRGAFIPTDRDGTYDENPFLSGTWITSMIPAEDMWNNISDYLLSIKEKPIVDTRNDIQHLESHGFDKKTSFRNVK